MKWISAIKTDIDAARTKQADIPVWKTFRHKVFGRKVGQCPFRENEASVEAKKDKPIKTVLRCISHGAIGPIHESCHNT